VVKTVVAAEGLGDRVIAECMMGGTRSNISVCRLWSALSASKQCSAEYE